MQKKIIAVAVAGLSTAAFAQTNVTIYGVADVSGQGYAMSAGKGLNSDLNTGKVASGNVFSLQSNSSLIGFKGTEDLGNGLKALFQAETTLNLTGGNSTATGVVASPTANTAFGQIRDSYVGLNSKYGTAMAGYLSTPFRSTTTSFDVMPGATGSGTIEKFMGNMRFSNQSVLGNGSVTQGGYELGSSIRATAIAYAMPTLYGFNGSIAYTGSNNNGTDNSAAAIASTTTTQGTQQPVGALSMNLGWTGYGVNIAGAFQQAKVNLRGDTNTVVDSAAGYTSYLIGASYTGLPGLKVSAVYARNSLGINQTADTGANKLSNNQAYLGASYRIGNWEPRASAAWTSDINGGGEQLGARQWTANLGYYLSKRTQVYGLVSNLNNSANQNYTLGLQANRLSPTGGQNLFTYGMGVRTTF